MNKTEFENYNTPFPEGTKFVGVREKIIGNTLKIIANDGGDKFSLNKILAKAKVSKGSFYHHFKNIDELYLICFEMCKSFVKPDLKATDFNNVESFLIAFGEETFERTMSKQFFRLTMFFGQKAMVDDRFMKVQKELTEIYQNELANLILAIKPSLQREKVIETVGFILIVHQGITSHRIVFKDQERMSRIWQKSVKAALDMME